MAVHKFSLDQFRSQRDEELQNFSSVENLNERQMNRREKLTMELCNISLIENDQFTNDQKFFYEQHKGKEVSQTSGYYNTKTNLITTLFSAVCQSGKTIAEFLPPGKYKALFQLASDLAPFGKGAGKIAQNWEDGGKNLHSQKIQVLEALIQDLRSDNQNTSQHKQMLQQLMQALEQAKREASR